MKSDSFLKKHLPKLDKSKYENIKTIKSNEKSREGLIVPEIVSTLGKQHLKISNLIVAPKMIKTLAQAKKSYSSIKKNINNNKTEIDSKTLCEFKELAKSLDISDIAFTQVDESMIFRNKEILYKNAIVLTMEMKKDKIDLAPSIDTNKEIFRTYYELGKSVNILSKFLRDNGFNVQGGPALGGDVIYPLLAENAGLGATGKHGILITPEHGPSIRIAAIYVDISNLPMNKENNHLWIKDFCKSCGRCIKTCPGKAIYQEAIKHENNQLTHIDYKKCAIPFTRDYGCSVCIKECTFFKSDYYKIKEKFCGHI